jgi:hypothetical protein
MNEVKFVVLFILAPFFIYFCVKFGTIGYYKAKQFIEKEKTKGV